MTLLREAGDQGSPIVRGGVNRVGPGTHRFRLILDRAVPPRSRSVSPSRWHSALLTIRNLQYSEHTSARHTSCPGAERCRLITRNSPDYHRMKTKKSATDRESPARRLEILYLTSFGAVALLLTISQAFILWELSGQGDTMRLLDLSSRRRSLDWSLSLAALSIQAADDPQASREPVKSLRGAVRKWERDSAGSSRPDSAPRPSSSSASEIDRIFGRAEPHAVRRSGQPRACSKCSSGRGRGRLRRHRAARPERRRRRGGLPPNVR